MTPVKHGGTVEVEPEALLAEDFELQLVWAPLHEMCKGGPECDALCHCQESDSE